MKITRNMVKSFTYDGNDDMINTDLKTNIVRKTRRFTMTRRR
jgi:hypothetical protein